jgi:hypothetical protein
VLRTIKEAMLFNHPELSDPEEFPEIRGRPHTEYSPEKFDELMDKDDLCREEYGPAVRHYDDP